MSWFKLSVPVADDQVEGLSSHLEEIGAIAITLTSGDERALFGGLSEVQQLWSRTWVTGLFDAALEVSDVVTQLDLSPSVTAAIKTEQVGEQDWQRSWMQDFKPQKFGQQLWVRPSWCHIDKVEEPDALEIVLDPGMAFGTGTHPTTHMCLQWLASYHALPGALVVDFGCGSGILALSALRLGAARAWAVDVDEKALAIARANAELNDLTHQLLVCSPAQLGLEQVDIVVANILAGPLVALAPRLAELLVSGGQLVLSGIIHTQIDDCVSAFQDYFEMEAPVLMEEWALLVGTRA